MNESIVKRAGRRRRGSALMAIVVLVIGLAAVSLTLVSMVSGSGKEQRSVRDDLSSLYVSEAGIAEAVFDLAKGGTGRLGDENVPVNLGTGASYYVEAVDNAGEVMLTATGSDRGMTSRVEAIVKAVAAGGWTWAAFGDQSMTMDSNARVDSYDSRNGTYASQAVNGSGSSQYANSNGDIGSNGNVSMDSNTKVWGAARPGPTGSTNILGKAVVTGSTVPMLSPIPMPALTIPTIASSGSLTVSGAQTLVGDHRFTDLEIDGTVQLSITGPASIVIDNFTLNSNSSVIVDATSGPVEFFVLDDFVMSSNTLIRSTTFNPADVTINLESDNILDPNLNVDLDEIDFNSNAQLYGTVYAPNASVEINSNFELFGGIMAKRMHLDSNARIHYDEALGAGSIGTRPQFEILCWRVVSADA